MALLHYFTEMLINLKALLMLVDIVGISYRPGG